MMVKQMKKYQTVEVTNLKTMTKTYKIYEVMRGKMMDRLPVASGIPTREEAVKRLNELEAGKP
jgi:hypothetical protein